MPKPTPKSRVAACRATIWAWDTNDPNGWIPEPIVYDGAYTPYSTPHTFTGLTGTHTFEVPSSSINGTQFHSWDTGERETVITISSGGTYTAQYQYFYDVTIWAWDPSGWQSVPIDMDRSPTGFSTPHTFYGLWGVHEFAVPVSENGHPFYAWDNGALEWD